MREKTDEHEHQAPFTRTALFSLKFMAISILSIHAQTDNKPFHRTSLMIAFRATMNSSLPACSFLTSFQNQLSTWCWSVNSSLIFPIAFLHLLLWIDLWASNSSTPPAPVSRQGGYKERAASWTQSWGPELSSAHAGCTESSTSCTDHLCYEVIQRYPIAEESAGHLPDSTAQCPTSLAS